MRRLLALLPIALLALPACRSRNPQPALGVVVPLVPNADRASARPSAPTSDRPEATTFSLIRDRPAPTGALGVTFGQTVAEVTALHRAANIPCRPSGEYLFCEGALQPLPVRVLVTYEFCGAALCSVAVDGTRSDDEDLLMREYDSLLDFARRSLGAPISSARRIGPGCRGHLPLCLTSRQSQLNARWSWPDGPQIELSVDQLEDDALQAQAAITWLSTERVHRPAPDPVRDASVDAAARPDAAALP
ncbi:MAG: hypothetical protein IPN17_02035 [Deltaproteobacteria bacterium]|nr:hypothetical protein [Deltaproteobacteria bacterium]